MLSPSSHSYRTVLSDVGFLALLVMVAAVVRFTPVHGTSEICGCDDLATGSVIENIQMYNDRWFW